MRRAGYTRWLTLILVAVLWLCGCGSGAEPLDEVGWRYYISSVVAKDRNAATNDIDIAQSCPDPTIGLLTKATMDLTVSAADDAEYDIYLYRISIRYDLLEYNGTADPPPSIPTVPRPVTILIPYNGSQPVPVDLLTLAQKYDYRDQLDSYDEDATFQVTVTAYMTFTPSEPQNDYETSYSFQIQLTDFADGSCAPPAE